MALRDETSILVGRGSTMNVLTVVLLCMYMVLISRNAWQLKQWEKLLASHLCAHLGHAAFKARSARLTPPSHPLLTFSFTLHSPLHPTLARPSPRTPN